ncbi:hypothetical protein SEVIR_5G241401v4 [Setaria viridis]
MNAICAVLLWLHESLSDSSLAPTCTYLVNNATTNMMSVCYPLHQSINSCFVLEVDLSMGRARPIKSSHPNFSCPNYYFLYFGLGLFFRCFVAKPNNSSQWTLLRVNLTYFGINKTL